MRLFSKIEFGRKESPPNDNGEAEWNTLGEQVPFVPEQERAQANTERQQRKIIAGMLYNARYLNSPDVDLPQGAEETFLAKINSGEIDENAQRNFLRKISGPIQLEGAQAIDEKLGNDKHFRRILGYALSGHSGFDNYATMTGESTISNFEAVFPTPMDFEKVRNSMLEGIQRGSSEAKYLEYVKDMDAFQDIVYGKKYEYYKSLSDLKEKGKHSAVNTDLKPEFQTTDVYPNTEREQTYEYTNADKERILQESIIDGDDFLYLGQKYKLTPEILAGLNLGPEHKMMLDGMEIGLSGCFDVNGRDAVLGYVKTDEGYKVRSFYRSNSQGIWRYLPDYVSDGGEGNGVSWYGKSYTEEMTNLPCEMQKELSLLAMREQRIPVHESTMPEFVLAGTAKAYSSKAAYRQASAEHTHRGDIYREVDRNPEINLGNLSLDKQSPENVKIDTRLSPDYSRELMSWESDTGTYGHLTNRVFSSHDGRLKYTISEDTQGKCFVSSIETNAKPTSCGVRSEWVSGGDVETPLYEYSKMSSGYGDFDDMRGRYVGMWKNYVSKLQIIQDYMQRTSAQNKYR